LDATLDWIFRLFGHAGTQLVIGAFLAGLVGWGFTVLETRQSYKRAREGWGAILYDQMYSQGPPNDPIGSDPPTVRLVNYSALQHILQPGVLDPQKESALLSLLNFFDSVVQDYNYRAHTYNSAWASRADYSMLEKCRLDLYMSNMDFKEQYQNVMQQMWELYTPGKDTIYVRQKTIQEHYERLYAETPNEPTPPADDAGPGR
jgi:hypothetical protein